MSHAADKSPGAILLAWFDSLPNEAKQDMSFLALAAISDAPGDLQGMNAPEKQFREWIEGIKDKTGLRHAGAVVHARAIIDFVVMRRRGSAQEWAHTKAQLRAVMEITEQRGGDASNFKSSLQQLDLRAKRWIRIVKDWRELCASHLSDKSLDDWWQAGVG